jgi:hypothetical protein
MIMTRAVVRIATSGACGILTTGLCLVGVAAPASAETGQFVLVRPTITGGATEIDLKAAKSRDSTYLAAWDPASQRLTRLTRRGAQASAERTAPSTSDDDDAVHVAFNVNAAGVITDRAVVQTSSRVVDPATGRIPTQWSVSTHAVSLSWWQPAGPPVTWRVAVDGRAVTSTRANSWVDTSSDTGRAHTYTITGTQRRMSGSKVTSEAPYLYEVMTSPLDTRVLGASVADPQVSSLAMNADLRAASWTTKVGISYRAYIAPKYLKAPLFCKRPGKRIAYYGGDNRGFAKLYSSAVHRSRSEITRAVKFTDSGASRYKLKRFTGDTHTYDKHHKLLRTKNAGPTSVEKLIPNRDDYHHIEGELEISGANPLCSHAPKINGRVFYNINRTGRIHLSGDHDQAPNHEIVYFFDQGYPNSWHAYRRSVKSFNCLAAGVCAKATFDLSVESGEI